MCKETFEVHGLKDPRTRYEVEQYLKGLPSIEDAQCDSVSNELTVEWDEDTKTKDYILDEIERAGCTPSERVGGVMDQLRVRVADVL